MKLSRRQHDNNNLTFEKRIIIKYNLCFRNSLGNQVCMCVCLFLGKGLFSFILHGQNWLVTMLNDKINHKQRCYITTSTTMSKLCIFHIFRVRRTLRRLFAVALSLCFTFAFVYLRLQITSTEVHGNAHKCAFSFYRISKSSVKICKTFYWKPSS